MKSLWGSALPIPPKLMKCSAAGPGPPGSSALCVRREAALIPSIEVQAPPPVPAAGSGSVKIQGGMGHEDAADGPLIRWPVHPFRAADVEPIFQCPMPGAVGSPLMMLCSRVFVPPILPGRAVENCPGLHRTRVLPPDGYCAGRSMEDSCWCG